MDKKTQNKFNMYKVVYNWLVTNTDNYTYLPGFAETLTDFGKTIDEVTQQDVGKGIITSGVTKTKIAARETLELGMIEMARIVKVFATFSNNQILLNDIDYTESQLSRSAEQLLIVRAQKLIDHAVTIQVDAEPYGLSVERIEALKTANTAFIEKQTSVRHAIVSRKNSGEQLDDLMDKADELLKGKLDLLLELSQNQHPELYNQYKASRVIIDR